MRVTEGDKGRQGEEGGRGGGRGTRVEAFSQVTGAFLNVNGLQSKTQALQAWLDKARHPPDVLGFVETNKEEGEAPALLVDYTRVAVSGSGGRRNRGAELYIHKDYHHRAEARYAAPQGNALLVEIQATRTTYSILLAHGPHVMGGSGSAYRAWWARILQEVSSRVDLRSVLVLADANSVARAEDRGSRRPGGRA